MTEASRVIVGVSGSPGSLRALRYADAVARAHHAALIPVTAWAPPGGDSYRMRQSSDFLRREWEEIAVRRLRDACCSLWGEVPLSPSIHPHVERGPAGWVLVSIASRPDDLLVVGAGRRGPLSRLIGGQVCRYCMTHAECAVVLVPPPELARRTGNRLTAWVSWHRALTPERILRESGAQPPGPPVGGCR
jgi:nucleotide-binding universal stress UspA family protein